MTLRIAMAQLAQRVGDIDHNVTAILQAWRRAADLGADLVVFPELAVTGYPPEDLLLKPEFLAAIDRAPATLAAHGPTGTVAIIGTVGRVGSAQDVGGEDVGGEDVGGEDAARRRRDVTVAAGSLRNRALVIADSHEVAAYDKWRLPNYGVFDEARWFIADDDSLVVTVNQVPVGITICEDLWADPGPVRQAVAAGATVVVSLNASPWHRDKRALRQQWLTHHARTHDLHLVWVNTVGGQDNVVFDGDSAVVSPDGSALAQCDQFAADLVVVDIPARTGHGWGPRLAGHAGPRSQVAVRNDEPRLEPLAEVWTALVTATRDYVTSNGFSEVIVALSGGLDSAVTAAIAADAIGGEQVIGVLLPSPWSSDHSIDDALALADNLGMRRHTIPIARGMAAMDDMLAASLAAETTGVTADDGHVSLTEENIQARLRGVAVMALSNATGALVLATGNRSEYAVGYATLYGDMAGGFAPIKDVPKTLVWDLARHRNTLGTAIPQHTIDKPPSAELKPGQLDADSLPTYEVLDEIIAASIEHDLGIAEIVARGHDEAMVRRVLAMIDRAEYKRRQAAVGPKVTSRAFGKERRVPITHGWRG